MAVREILGEAIRQLRVVSLVYKEETRIVEPHMVALDWQRRETLLAWCTQGASRTPGWREYLLAELSQVQMLHETFPGPRPGYDRSRGLKYSSVIHCL